MYRNLLRVQRKSLLWLLDSLMTLVTLLIAYVCTFKFMTQMRSCIGTEMYMEKIDDI